MSDEIYHDEPTNVAGAFNSMFTRDIPGAMSAVIVNPQASMSQRLAWGMGQLELLKVVAEVAEQDGSASPLASAVRELLEQSMAVLRGVLDEMEQPPELQQAQPLRAV